MNQSWCQVRDNRLNKTNDKQDQVPLKDIAEGLRGIADDLEESDADAWRTRIETLRECADDLAARECAPSARGDKDAERYRWLVMNMRVARAGTDGVRHYIDVPPAVSMDEAIDLAMKQTK